MDSLFLLFLNFSHRLTQNIQTRHFGKMPAINSYYLAYNLNPHFVDIFYLLKLCMQEMEHLVSEDQLSVCNNPFSVLKHYI